MYPYNHAELVEADLLPEEKIDKFQTLKVIIAIALLIGSLVFIVIYLRGWLNSGVVDFQGKQITGSVTLQADGSAHVIYGDKTFNLSAAELALMTEIDSNSFTEDQLLRLAHAENDTSLQSEIEQMLQKLIAENMVFSSQLVMKGYAGPRRYSLSDAGKIVIDNLNR